MFIELNQGTEKAVLLNTEHIVMVSKGFSGGAFITLDCDTQGAGRGQKICVSEYYDDVKRMIIDKEGK